MPQQTLHAPRANRIIAQTLTVNTGSRAVFERVGLTYVRTFPTSTTESIEGVEEGEVEYELTREAWEREASSRGETGRRPPRLTGRF